LCSTKSLYRVGRMEEEGVTIQTLKVWTVREKGNRREEKKKTDVTWGRQSRLAKGANCSAESRVKNKTKGATKIDYLGGKTGRRGPMTERISVVSSEQRNEWKRALAG